MQEAGVPAEEAGDDAADDSDDWLRISPEEMDRMIRERADGGVGGMGGMGGADGAGGADGDARAPSASERQASSPPAPFPSKRLLALPSVSRWPAALAS